METIYSTTVVVDIGLDLCYNTQMRINKNRKTGTGFKMYYELSGDKLIRKIREAKAKTNVPNKPTMPPPPTVKNEGVHRTHCCVAHGCKYGNRECPVETGQIKQDYVCEDCTAAEDVLTMIRNRSAGHKRIKASDSKSGEDVLTMIRNRMGEHEERIASEIDVPEETNNIKVKTLNIDDLRRIFQAAE